MCVYIYTALSTSVCILFVLVVSVSGGGKKAWTAYSERLGLDRYKNQTVYTPLAANLLLPVCKCVYMLILTSYLS